MWLCDYIQVLMKINMLKEELVLTLTCKAMCLALFCTSLNCLSKEIKSRMGEKPALPFQLCFPSVLRHVIPQGTSPRLLQRCQEPLQCFLHRLLPASPAVPCLVSGMWPFGLPCQPGCISVSVRSGAVTPLLGPSPLCVPVWARGPVSLEQKELHVKASVGKQAALDAFGDWEQKENRSLAKKICVYKHIYFIMCLKCPNNSLMEVRRIKAVFKCPSPNNASLCPVSGMNTSAWRPRCGLWPCFRSADRTGPGDLPRRLAPAGLSWACWGLPTASRGVCYHMNEIPITRMEPKAHNLRTEYF